MTDKNSPDKTITINRYDGKETHTGFTVSVWLQLAIISQKFGTQGPGPPITGFLAVEIKRYTRRILCRVRTNVNDRLAKEINTCRR